MSQAGPNPLQRMTLAMGGGLVITGFGVFGPHFASPFLDDSMQAMADPETVRTTLQILTGLFLGYMSRPVWGVFIASAIVLGVGFSAIAPQFLTSQQAIITVGALLVGAVLARVFLTGGRK